MDYYHHVPPPFRGYGVLQSQTQLHPQPQSHPQQHPQLQPLPQSQPQPLLPPNTDRGIPTDIYRAKPVADPVQPKKKKRSSVEIDIECLIEEVKKRPACHYQRSVGSGQDENEQGWQEISQVMGISADALKKKWQYLRSGFMRTHRALLISTTDKVRENALKWKYYKQLEFLVSHLDLNKKHFSEVIENMENKAEEPALPSEDSDEDYDTHAMDDMPMMDDDRTSPKLRKSSLRKMKSDKLHKVPKERKNKPAAHKAMRRRKRKISDDDPLIALATSKFPKLPKLSHKSRNPVNQLFLMTTADCDSSSGMHKKLSKKKKMKRLPTNPEEVNERILEIILQRDDADQKFLLSLLPTLKRLPAKRNIQAKLLMQQALNNTVYPNEKTEKHSSRSKNKKVPNDSYSNQIHDSLFSHKSQNKVIPP